MCYTFLFSFLGGQGGSPPTYRIELNCTVLAVLCCTVWVLYCAPLCCTGSKTLIWLALSLN